MTPLTHEPVLTADDWLHFKALWFSLENASPEEQQRLLAIPTISPHVRRRAERMLTAAANGDTRFDTLTPVAFSLDHALRDARGAEAYAGTLVGQRLGPYRVVRLVGHGGMGAVYEAERDDAEYRQRVAIKTIWRGADSEVLLQRFRSERQILAALQHPNIAQLVDGGATSAGGPWLAMEFVDGVPLDEYCDRQRLSLSARLDLFRQVCTAVNHAHQRLVIHRDLKPSNVLVTADGTVKLLDFGVAKLLDDPDATGTLTAAGLSPFTAAYAAPEQARGDMASTATDVYALGALLCTLLTGAPPLDFVGLDSISRVLAVRDGASRVPSAIARHADHAVAKARGFDTPRLLANAIDGELDAIVLAAVERDPRHRYYSALALSDDVRRYLRRERVLAKQGTLGYRVWAFSRRHRSVVFGVTFALLTAIGVSITSRRQARNLRDEAARAERAATFMAGILSGTSTASQDPIVRVGPAGTVGQLLDSAVTRVPREFPLDDRIRTRLYTAFGANYASQYRYDRAHAILDSARALARRSYGSTSEAYARASLEAASLELVFHGSEAAEEPLDAARRSKGTDDSTSALNARVMLLRAMQEFNRGHIRLADSLAERVISLERRVRGLTNALASAENVRLSATSWITRDPRIYLQRARALETITDSLGMQYSGERDQAADAVIESMLVLGRADSAAVRTREHVARLRRVYGAQASVQIWAAKAEASLAGLRGDTAARRVALAGGRSILDTLAAFPIASRVVFSNAFIDDALARKNYVSALSMARSTRDAVLPSHSPLYLSFSHLYLGAVQLANNDAAAAEASFRAGLDVIATTPDLASMAPRLRRPLAAALAAQGKHAEADSVRRLDPPKAAVPACTPGGKWAGCPDK